MDPSGEIQMLQFLARRLIKLPAPDLTILELQEVLQWQLVPNSSSGIYEYAWSASMILNCLDEVDRKCLDSKTEKLISSALKKNWAIPLEIADIVSSSQILLESSLHIWPSITPQILGLKTSYI
jgi:hypothetical protein